MQKWELNNITENDGKICKQVKNLFKQWIADYDSQIEAERIPTQPTPEELAMIEMLRNKGLI